MVLAPPSATTRPAGTRLTASIYSADVTNSVSFLANPPDFVGTQATTQSIGNQVWVGLSLDTHQLDSYSGHSDVTNNSRYTAQESGWYTCGGVYAAVGNSTGFRAVRLQVNGTAVAGTGAYVVANGTSEAGVVTPTRDVFLNVNDYVEVAGWQSSGGSLNTAVDMADLRCALWVRFSHE